MNFKIEDFVKDGISKNAKNQISFNNFIQAERMKSHMTQQEEVNRKKKEKKDMEIKKVVDSKNEKPKPYDPTVKKQKDTIQEGEQESKNSQFQLKQQMRQLEKKRQEEKVKKQSRETADKQNQQNGSNLQKEATTDSQEKEEETKPKKPKKLTREEEFAQMKEQIRVEKEEAHNRYLKREKEKEETFANVIVKCTSDDYEADYTDDDAAIERQQQLQEEKLTLQKSNSKTDNLPVQVPKDFQNKLDLSKFRTAFICVKINQDIKKDIEDSRLKKEEAERMRIEEEMNSKYAPKTKKQKKIGGMTVEELHAKQKQLKMDALAAKKRHLKRAMAGIDKTQKQPENLVFKTVDRNRASQAYEKHPQGTEVGRYNPTHPGDPEPTCFVRIKDEKATRDELKKFKDPSLQYAQGARCKDFGPQPQHTEIPQVNCCKLDKKLENFKNIIYTTSKRRTVNLKEESFARSRSRTKSPKTIRQGTRGSINSVKNPKKFPEAESSFVKVKNSVSSEMDNNMFELKLGNKTGSFDGTKATGAESVTDSATFTQEEDSKNQLLKNKDILKFQSMITTPQTTKNLNNTQQKRVMLQTEENSLIGKGALSSVESQGISQSYNKLTPRKAPQALVEKSKQLKRIYEEKDSIEKKYGEAVRSMSPINYVNGQYTAMYTNHSVDNFDGSLIKVKSAAKRYRGHLNAASGMNQGHQGGLLESQMHSLKDSIFHQDSVQKKSKNKIQKSESQSKIPEVLQTLHKKVSRVSVVGLNSNLNYSIDYIASSRGLKQLVQGKNQSNLPEINFDKQQSRDYKIFVSGDNPHEERFTNFDHMPNIRAKGYNSSRHVPNLGKGALRFQEYNRQQAAKIEFGANHYFHDPKFELVENKDATLIPFDVKADFSKTQNIISPNTEERLAVELDKPHKLILQQEGFPYEKYRSNFKKVHRQKLQNELNQRKKKEASMKAYSKIKTQLSVIVDVNPLRSRGPLSKMFNGPETATTPKVFKFEDEQPIKYFKPKHTVQKEKKDQQGVGASHYFVMND